MQIPVLEGHGLTQSDIKHYHRIENWKQFKEAFGSRKWYLLKKSPWVCYPSANIVAWDSLHLPFALCKDD